MAGRYDSNKEKKLKDGRVVYRTKIYPNIPKKDSDVYVVTQGGDRLDTLAYQFYKDSSLWWVIASANNHQRASLAVTPGIQLRIPADKSEAIRLFNEVNSTR